MSIRFPPGKRPGAVHQPDAARPNVEPAAPAQVPAPVEAEAPAQASAPSVAGSAGDLVVDAARQQQAVANRLRAPDTKDALRAADAIAQALQGMAARGTQALDVMRQLASPDTPLCVAIGAAEGTRSPDGARTAAYAGQVDAWNKRQSVGTFAYQAPPGAAPPTPEQADQLHLEALRARAPAYEAAARQAGLDPSTPLLQAAFFDLATQASPRICQRFLDRLGALQGRPLDVETLVRARVNAMHDERGVYTAMAPKTADRAEADQRKRMETLATALQQQLAQSR